MGTVPRASFRAQRLTCARIRRITGAAPARDDSAPRLAR